MIGEPFWYWLVFVAIAALWATVVVIVIVERRADRRDRQHWNRLQRGEKL